MLQKKNRNILFVLSSITYGGMSSNFLHMTKFFKKKKFKIFVSCLDTTSNSKFGQYKKWKNISKIKHLKGSGSLRKINFLNEVNNFFTIFSLIKRNKIDIVYSSCPWSRYLIFMISIFVKIIHFSSRGSTWVYGFPHKLLSNIFCNFHMCDFYTVFSNIDQKQHIQILKISSTKLIQMSMGLDLVKNKPYKKNLMFKKKFGFKAKDLILFKGSRLDDDKGLIGLIKVFNKLKKVNSRWKLLICGEGAIKLDLKRLIMKYNLENNIKLLKYQKSLKPFFNISDFALQYSSYPHNNLFNLGQFTVESMCNGVPILHYIPEYLSNGYEEGINGYYVSYEKKRHILFKKLRQIEKFNNKKIIRLKKNARKFAIKNYDIRKSFNNLEKKLIDLKYI